MHAQPVFSDPSGRRQRLMRRVGLAVAAVLAVCLGLVVVAMAGGPQAPLTHWAAPQSPAAAGRGDPAGSRLGSSGGATPTAGARKPAGPSPTADPSPSPSPSASTSPSAVPSSPAATNPAGKTTGAPSRSPNPHKSTRGP